MSVVVENITVATAKLAGQVSQQFECRHWSCEISPVSIGKVAAVLEGCDKDDGRDHH